MLPIDLSGRRALVAGVADDNGFGFAIAKSLAEAGASVCTATWPPALNIFLTLIERGKLDDARRLPDGSLLTFERIYPLDAAFDTLSDAPAEIRENKRYRDIGDFSIEGLAKRMSDDFGPGGLDIIVHSLANGPELMALKARTSFVPGRYSFEATPVPRWRSRTAISPSREGEGLPVSSTTLSLSSAA